MDGPLALADRRLLAAWMAAGDRTPDALAARCGGDAARAARLWPFADAMLRQPDAAADPELVIDQPLGSGATAEVYRGRWNGNPVAVKYPLHVIGRDLIERFHRDAGAAVRFDHPHVVRVLAVRTDHCPHIVMELADGSLRQRLAERLAAGRATVPADQAVALVRPLAAAADYLHRDHQLVHRDIKPANILLFDGPDDPGGWGTPKLADFGSARFHDSTATRTAETIGTPSYMAPEQARGEPADARADVYALGAVLYELLAGTPPFVGETPERVLHQVRTARPPAVRRVNPDVPADLETVCLRCLEKRPADRFGSAAELADELGRVAAGKPVLSRPPGPVTRVRRWAAANRRAAAAVGLIAGLAAALMVGLLGFGLYYRRTTADLERRVAAEEESRYAADLARAEVEIQDNRDIALARRLLDDCPDRLRGWEHAHLRARIADDRRGTRVFGLDGPPNPGRGVWAAAASPDGSLVATATINEGVRLYHPDGRDAGRLDTPTLAGVLRLPAFAVAFRPDGRRLAVATQHAGPPADARAGELPGQFLRRLAFRNVVQVWDVPARRLAFELDGHADNIKGLAFSPDGSRLASGGFDQTVRLWDADAGRPLGEVGRHDRWVHSVQFSPDGRRLASAGADGKVRVWDADGGGLRDDLTAHHAPATGTAFDPTGRLLVTCGMDGMVKLWDAAGGRLRRALPGHLGPVLAVAVAPDGRRVASAGFDRTVKVWDPADGRLCLTLRGHDDMIWSADFVRGGPDAGALLTAGFDATVRVWGTADPPGDPAAVPDAPAGGPPAAAVALTNDVAVRPDGRQHAVAWWDGRVTVHAGPGDPGRPLARAGGRPAHDGPVWRVCYSADGRRLATASWDGAVRVWEADAGGLVGELPAGAGGHAVAFAPDGGRLLVGTIDGRAAVWDLAAGRKAFDLDRGLAYFTYAAAWSPDGRRVVTAGYTPGVYVWDAATGAPVAELGSPVRVSAGDLLGRPDPGVCRAAVYRVAFAPDGRSLAAVSWDRRVRVWAVPDAGRPWPAPAVGDGHTDYVCGLAFSPDGRTLATGGRDKTVRFWAVGPGDRLTQVGVRELWGEVWGLAWHPTVGLLAADWDQDTGVKAIAPPAGR